MYLFLNILIHSLSLGQYHCLTCFCFIIHFDKLSSFPSFHRTLSELGSKYVCFSLHWFSFYPFAWSLNQFVWRFHPPRNLEEAISEVPQQKEAAKISPLCIWDKYCIIVYIVSRFIEHHHMPSLVQCGRSTHSRKPGF